MELKNLLSLTILVLVAINFSQAALTKVCPGKPADIVFIIDESSSIWPVHFKRQREFIANLTDSFDVGPEQTRIAAVTFADKVTKRFDFDQFGKNEEVRSAIQRIDQKTGGTRTDKALKFVRHKIFTKAREGVPKIAVLITDGASWYPDLTKHEASLLHHHNVTVFAVAISSQINWAEINIIASDPDEAHVFGVSSFDDLGETLVEKLVTSTCKVQGNPVGVCTIDFKSDVMFVLGSASQNPLGALQAMTMIQTIIADKNTFVGKESLRFGLLPKDCQSNFGFDLNSYDNKGDILLHLERKRNLLTPADHLDSLVTHAFTPENGDRPDVRNLAVVILDEKSPDYQKTVAAANRAKASGIEIIAVAIGKNVDDNEITQIASEPVASHKITLSDYSEIVDLKHKFYSLICP